MPSLFTYFSKNRPPLKRIGLAIGFLSLAGSSFILDSCSTFTPITDEIQYRPAQDNDSKVPPTRAHDEKQNASSNKMASLPNASLRPSAPPADKPRTQLIPQDLPVVLQDDMDWKSLEQVIQNQLAVMEAQNEHKPVTLEGLNLTIGDLKNSLNAFLDLLRQNLEPDEFNLRVRKDFTFYKAGQGSDKKFLFTGYYTPVIPASPVKTEEYIYPLYRLPDDSPELNFINLAHSENSKNEARPNWKDFTREQIDRHHWKSPG
jgi:hypothetical protein